MVPSEIAAVDDGEDSCLLQDSEHQKASPVDTPDRARSLISHTSELKAGDPAGVRDVLAKNTVTADTTATFSIGELRG